MKYITEYDLRTRFQQQPFVEYQLKEGTRLTPGAKQFLSDQRIPVREESKNVQAYMQISEDSNHEKDVVNNFESMITDTESLERKVLNQAKQSISEDVELTLQLIDMTAAISRIRDQLTQISTNIQEGKNADRKNKFSVLR